MVTLEDARAAKASLRYRIGQPTWLRGIGIGGDPALGYTVRVNVAGMTEEVRSLPSSIDGVPVEIRVVGDVAAQAVGMAPVREVTAPGEIAGTALALSGGGFRAALFHLGVVERLYELRVLDEVSYLSTVSGGSLVGAILALHWRTLRATDVPSRRAVFDDLIAKPLCRLASADVRNRALRRCLFPWNLLKARGNVLADALDDLYFQGKTLADLPEPDAEGLRVAINSTNLRSGKRFRFSQDSIGDYECYSGAPTAGVRLATAVAASAAYPPAFAPLVLPFPRPYYAWTFDAPAERVEVVGPRNPEVALVDGGVYDNLGLSGARRRAKRIIAVDAGAPLGLSDGMAESIPATSLRAVDVMMTRILNADVASFVQALTGGTVEGCYIRASRSVGYVAFLGAAASGADAPLPGLPDEDARRLALLRTDFDAFSDLEIAVLRYHGRSLADAFLRRFAATWVSQLPPVENPPALSKAERVDLDRGAERCTASFFNLWSGR